MKANGERENKEVQEVCSELHNNLAGTGTNVSWLSPITVQDTGCCGSQSTSLLTESVVNDKNEVEFIEGRPSKACHFNLSLLLLPGAH